MQLVKYKKINDEEVKNLVDGKLYWIDEKSKTRKKGCKIFVDVYSDENKTEKIGRVEIYRFLNVSELISREETTVEVTKHSPYYEFYYCPVCGEHIEEWIRYCPYCATVLGWKLLG